MKAKFLSIYILFFCFVVMKAVDVSTVEELHQALANAKPGQTIFIAPGEYDYSTYEDNTSFKIRVDGTEAAPITLTAKDPNDPPFLRGPRVRDNAVLSFNGNYWIIENIKLGISSQAIAMTKGNHNIVRNVEMFSLGSSGVFLRETCTNNLFENCYIHNTGVYNDMYGSGFAIRHQSNNNIIKGCVFRHVSSWHIHIEEYTSENEIVGNIFYGDGINGKNEANTFISINGDDNYILNNVGYRNLNKHISAAFEIKKVVEDSGDGNRFVNNALFMDRPYGEKDKEKKMYIVDGVDAQFYVKNNRVDYGEGLINANTVEYYNSDSVTFLE